MTKQESNELLILNIYIFKFKYLFSNINQSIFYYLSIFYEFKFYF
jgi:hypothetical protein